MEKSKNIEEEKHYFLPDKELLGDQHTIFSTLSESKFVIERIIDNVIQYVSRNEDKRICIVVPSLRMMYAITEQLNNKIDVKNICTSTQKKYDYSMSYIYYAFQNGSKIIIELARKLNIRGFYADIAILLYANKFDVEYKHEFKKNVIEVNLHMKYCTFFCYFRYERNIKQYYKTEDSDKFLSAYVYLSNSKD
jgi:hypothetical protein